MALGGAVLAAASLVRGWLDFLDGNKHPAPASGTYVLWFAVVLLGFAAAAFAFAGNKEGALRASARIGAWLGSLLSAVIATVNRFVFAPVLDLTGRTGEWVPSGDRELGRAAVASGRFAAALTRAPAVPLLILLAVLLAVAVGLLSPGVFR
jgi:hypothetical protein